MGFSVSGLIGRPGRRGLLRGRCLCRVLSGGIES